MPTERVFEKHTAEWFAEHIGKSLTMRTKDQVMPLTEQQDADALFQLQEAGGGNVLFATSTDAEIATVAEATVGELNNTTVTGAAVAGETGID